MDYKNMSIKEINSLEKIKVKNSEKYKKLMEERKIHKILTCKTSVKLVKYVNRDINLVKNMKKNSNVLYKKIKNMFLLLKE